jgi:hypothetical protein
MGKRNSMVRHLDYGGSGSLSVSKLGAQLPSLWSKQQILGGNCRLIFLVVGIHVLGALEHAFDRVRDNRGSEPSGNLPTNFQLKDVFHIKGRIASGHKSRGEQVTLGPCYAIIMRWQQIVVTGKVERFVSFSTVYVRNKTTSTKIVMRTSREVRYPKS